MTPTPKRLASLDALRGLLIILMVFEHTRQILTGRIMIEAWRVPMFPLDLAGIIRMASHVCAPGFFFIMGISMVLKSRKNPDITHFIRRGCILIVLQFTIENIGWALSMPGGLASQVTTLYFGALFALGTSMVISALLLRLPGAWMACLAAFLTLSPHWVPNHENLLTGMLAHGLLEGRVIVFYPILPWTGITLLGVVLARRIIAGKSFHVSMSPLSAVASAVVLTLVAIIKIKTLPSWFGFYKYPPTFLFTLATLAAIIVLLEIFERFPVLDLPFLQRLGRHSLVIKLFHIYIVDLILAMFTRMEAWQTLFFATGFCFLISAVCAWHERLYADVFGAFAPRYDALMRRLGFYHAGELRKLLPPETGAPRALLDVAGGTGYLAARLAQEFERAVVLDQSPGMLRVARRRDLEIARGSALDMPFEDAEFDVVTCTDALHHIKDADLAVAEMARVLKPGGTVLIQEFHIRGLAGWCLCWFERIFIDSSRFITPDELQTVMERHGLPAVTHSVSHLEYVCVGCKREGGAA